MLLWYGWAFSESSVQQHFRKMKNVLDKSLRQDNANPLWDVPRWHPLLCVASCSLSGAGIQQVFLREWTCHRWVRQTTLSVPMGLTTMSKQSSNAYAVLIVPGALWEGTHDWKWFCIAWTHGQTQGYSPRLIRLLLKPGLCSWGPNSNNMTQQFLCCGSPENWRSVCDVHAPLCLFAIGHNNKWHPQGQKAVYKVQDSMIALRLGFCISGSVPKEQNHFQLCTTRSIQSR